MRHKSLWIGAAVLLLLGVLVGACDEVKDEINDKTSKTETFNLDMTEDWTPLYAIEYNGTKLNAICYADEITIDDLISATEYGDTWDSVKGYIDEIAINYVESRIKDNISAGGTLDLFLVSALPDALPIPSQISGQFDLDAAMWRVVDPNDISNDDRIASIQIPATADVDDWTEADFASGGQTAFEEQLMDFEEPFAFCLRLNVPTHGVTSADPDLRIKLRTSFDVTFTPL